MQIYVALVISAVATALAQVTLKAGMSTEAVQRALYGGTALDVIGAVIRSPAVAGGLAIYALSVGVWLYVLSRIEVSRAYPFVGLGVVVTMILGCAMFGESLSIQKILGTLLVAAGVYLVASA